MDKKSGWFGLDLYFSDLGKSPCAITNVHNDNIEGIGDEHKAPSLLPR